jgi:hypothetical protein
MYEQALPADRMAAQYNLEGPDGSLSSGVKFGNT